MPPRPVLLMHPSSLEHDTGSHPESIDRIRAVQAELERRDWYGYELVTSPAVDRDVLELVHPAAYIDGIAALAQRGGGALDLDTVISDGSFQAALHSAGGTVEMVRRVVDSGPGAIGFSIHRPPGHHAIPDRAMGFCLFNNVSIAAKYALDRLGVERVMILDWDVHHGNGTQDIFWDTDRVLFCSIHQWPLYPGSGRASEVGEGAGRAHTVNLPVPPNSGDAEFVTLVRDVAAPLARAYRPQLLLTSAGYDAHVVDPLANCNMTDEGFDAIAAITRALADELEIPAGFVLEGGYHTDMLARCVTSTMSILAAGGPLATGVATVECHPVATVALQHLAKLWPELGG